jgi:hypothetical protein
MLPTFVAFWTNSRMLSTRSLAGRFWMTITIKNAGHAPVLRHSSGEHDNHEAGTSI